MDQRVASNPDDDLADIITRVDVLERKETLRDAGLAAVGELQSSVE